MKQIVHGDSLDVLKTLEENSVDSIVTDPPYGLSFMGKKWDYDVPTVELWKEAIRVLKPGGHLLSFAGSRTYHRMAVNIEDAGFEIRDQIMWVYGSGFPKSLNIGKAVDKINGETGRMEKFTEWMRITGMSSKEINNITSTSMGSHYLTNKSQPAIPTAELWAKLRPHIQIMIPAWVDELVFRIEAEREVTGIQTNIANKNNDNTGRYQWNTKGQERKQSIDITKGTSPYEGWGTALKPAHEPIVVARKPLSESTIAENVLRWGTGGINIDGCRVEAKPRKTGTKPTSDEATGSGNTLQGSSKNRQAEYDELNLGRFPANFIHDGSDEVVGLFPDTKSGALKSTQYEKPSGNNDSMFAGDGKYTNKGYGSDSGSASRFFYCAKAPKSERWVYLTCNCQTVKLASWPKQDQNLNEQTGGTSPEADTYDEQSEVDLFSNTSISGKKKMAKSLSDTHSITSTTAKQTTDSAISSSSMPLNTSDSTEDVNLEMENGGSPAQSVKNSSKLQPTTGISPQKDGHCTGVVVPATSAGWYRKSVCVDCGSEVRHNGHPTQKPTSLMQYLVQLVTPAGGTVLDPFMGSGSTGKACVLEGFDFIGIELDAEYCKIAEARIRAVKPNTPTV